MRYSTLRSQQAARKRNNAKFRVAGVEAVIKGFLSSAIARDSSIISDEELTLLQDTMGTLQKVLAKWDGTSKDLGFFVRKR